MKRIPWIGLALLLAGCAPSGSEIQWVTSVRSAQGDSAQWAVASFDDARWREVTFWEAPHPQTVSWLRARVEIPEATERELDRPLAVTFAGLTSHELWWDGVLIGRGGTVGRARDEEIPGPIETLHAIPDSLSGAGVHVLALRVSAFHQSFTPSSDFLRLGVGPLEALVAERRMRAWTALASLSGILLATLLALVMFALARRDRTSLLLGLLGLSVVALLVVEAWRPLVGYTYDRHIVRLVAVCALTWIAGALLTAFVTARFPRAYGRWAFGGLLVAITIPPFVTNSWNDKTAGIDIVAFAFAIVWLVRAVIGRRRGAIPALVGAVFALALVLADGPSFLDRNGFFAFGVLLACLLVGHLLEWRDELVAREQALARSSRLEAELLKRQLQPHFLMNTLTVIGGWIEEDPPTAVRMIDALAEELRMLTRIADQTLIPLADELRLCRAHLETMGLRRETRYRLETEGVDETGSVPPAMLHTLVENAVTHGPEGAREATFTLTEERSAGRVRYVFSSQRGAEDPSADVGTGTRYVIARLREAWGEDWSLTQEAVGDVWRVAIEVPEGAS